MNPFRLIRKLFMAFRGGASRRDLFFAVIVGMGLGIIPGMNLTKGVFFFMLLFLNLNSGVAGVLYLITRLLRNALAPVMYHLGYFLIHSTPFEGVVRWTLATPVAAYLNWDVYAVAGGLAIVLVAGPILATFLTVSIGATHRGLSSSKLAEKRPLQILVRIIVGKPRPENKPLIRKGRCVVAILLLGVAGWASTRYVPIGIERGLVLGLEKLNGAEVNIRAVTTSLVTGTLTIEGLQVTDPAAPETNRVAADTLELKLSISALLRRQLVIDRILSEQMTMGSPRATPGEVYRSQEPGDGLLDSLLDKLGPIAQDPVRYYEQLKELNAKFQKIKDYLAKIPRGSKDRSEWELAMNGYLRASARGVLNEQPAWVIRSAKATHVTLIPDLPDFTIEATNLSSDPSLLDDKPQIKAIPNRDSMGGIRDRLQDALPWLKPDIDEIDRDETDPDAEVSDNPATGGLLDQIFNR